MSRIARLAERGCVSVEGPEAGAFLQGLITGDVQWLDARPSLHAGLLTPQGKILFEFIVTRRGERFDLETSRSRAPDLVRRLGLYKLRSKVAIADRGAELDVYATWNGGADAAAAQDAYADPRLPALGMRFFHPGATPLPAAEAADAYHAHRIECGVPDAELDYVLGDTFAHEAGFDLLGGVSFDKGCFIGQEVVSRMQHRGLARKRFIIVRGAADLPALRTEITAGDGAIAVGTMGSSVGRAGLALVRLDRAAEALHKGLSVRAGGIEVALEVPRWAPYTLAGHASRETGP